MDPSPDEGLPLVTQMWPVQNLCPKCACAQFRVFSRRDGMKVEIMRLECVDCEQAFDLNLTDRAERWPQTPS